MSNAIVLQAGESAQVVVIYRDSSTSRVEIKVDADTDMMIVAIDADPAIPYGAGGLLQSFDQTFQ